jgi:sugar lactone lactonase YvrE
VTVGTGWQLAYAGLAFPEGLRWHAGALHLSDIFAGEVLRLGGVQGAGWTVLARVPGNPSGLGWLPDGTLLAVSMLDRRVVAVRDGVAQPHADLLAFARGSANDMLVDPAGRAYVGEFGYDYVAGEERQPAKLLLVQPDGGVSVAAEEVWFPNGMALTPDGRTLLLAETPAQRITAFTVEDGGTLGDRRVWAALETARPDGISLDAQGAVWLASPGTGELLRVAEGGRVLDARTLPGPGSPSTCVLGGADGRELYVSVPPSHDRDECLASRGARIYVDRVAVPAAAWAR